MTTECQRQVSMAHFRHLGRYELNLLALTYTQLDRTELTDSTFDSR